MLIRTFLFGENDPDHEPLEPPTKPCHTIHASEIFVSGIAYLPLALAVPIRTHSLTIFPIAVHAELAVGQSHPRRQVRWVRFGARYLKGDRTDFSLIRVS